MSPASVAERRKHCVDNRMQPVDRKEGSGCCLSIRNQNISSHFPIAFFAKYFSLLIHHMYRVTELRIYSTK